MPGQRRNTDATKQVVHDRIADDHHILKFEESDAGCELCGRQQLFHHSAELFAHLPL